jgi:hypothetical protein
MKHWRAYAVAGWKTECTKHIEPAKKAREQIKEKGGRDYFSELKTINR